MNGRKSIAILGAVGISIVTLAGCGTANHASMSSSSANTALSNQATTTSTAVKSKLSPSNETLNSTTSSNQQNRVANTSTQTTSSGSKIIATAYSSSSDAVNAIENIEKSFGQVNPSGPPVDLGSGIKADFSGGVGSYSYKWHEGNWTILFKGWGDSSLGSQVAKSVVAYLHTHMLPAPAKKGVITIVQSSSSNTPEVSQNTVAWQVANHVYSLKENGDPLKALETVVGREGNQNPSNKPADATAVASGSKTATSQDYQTLNTVKYSTSETEKIDALSKQQGVTVYIPSKMGGPSGWYVPGTPKSSNHVVEVPFEDMSFYETSSWTNLIGYFSSSNHKPAIDKGGSYTLIGGAHGQWYTFKYTDGARFDLFALQEGNTWIGIEPNPAKYTIPELVQAVAETLQPLQ